MKHLFFVDESLSPELAIKLAQLGYSARHAREVQLKGADDEKVVEWAIKNKAVIIAGDLDFGELWYWRYRGKLSVIILRTKSYKIESQYKVIRFLHDNNMLKTGKIINSLVISTSSRYRIRTA
ncbi:DUF5615 family PIN-like protein [Candidatus Woesearchaeota archaeon]|nr:DUF5615 family PIN-like protein [Candidatus Woesearchaeota archaeon]